MSSNIFRIYKNKRSMIVFWLIVILPLIDQIQLFINKLKWDTNYNPYIASFLTGVSEGHIGQILLFWFLPIYLLILCSDDYIQDVQNGYNSIIISKLGKKEYIKTKLLTSFLFPASNMFIALMLNLMLSIILFWKGTYSLDYFETDWTGNALALFSQAYPSVTYILFLLNVCLITGLAGTIGMSISFIYPKRSIVYPLTFFIWFIQIVFHGSSLISIFQPFTEYGFPYVLPILIRTIIVFTLIPIFIYFFKVKKDELHS
ncbi:hypothetical protein ACQJ0Y_14490 [Peribacillus simplex]|uniref:hypothetical protein n=1 Tax=Peribacillus simplex TaxID=1478 RepID=UPI003CEB86F0